MSVHSIRELAKELAPYHVTSVALPAAKHLKSLAFDDSNFAAFREAEAIPAIVNALRAGSASPIAQAAADALWSLSADWANRQILRSAGAIPLLAQLLASADSCHTEPMTHSMVLTISNFGDLESGMPQEVSDELAASGGIEALLRLLPNAEDGEPVLHASETQQAAAEALAALSVTPVVGEHIGGAPHGILKLVGMMRAGGPPSALARNGAATLARMARNQPALQAAVREAGGVEALIALLVDSVAPHGAHKFGHTESEKQAAQHAAGALWVMAAEPESREMINAHADARQVLASLLNGRLGPKADGNAAGVLLVLGNMAKPKDPCSVVTATMEVDAVNHRPWSR